MLCLNLASLYYKTNILMGNSNSSFIAICIFPLAESAAKVPSIYNTSVRLSSFGFTVFFCRCRRTCYATGRRKQNLCACWRTVPASDSPRTSPLARLCCVRLNGIYVLQDMQSQPVFLKQLTINCPARCQIHLCFVFVSHPGRVLICISCRH